jgi:hypothetical protein
MLSFRPAPKRVQRVEVEVEKPASLNNQKVRRRGLLQCTAAALFAGALALCPPLLAQGCTQCQDNTAATPPRTQAAYRHAIILLTVTAGSLFAGTLFLFRRSR